MQSWADYLGHQHEPVVHVLEGGHVGVVDPVLEPVEQVVDTRGPGVDGRAEAEHQGEADHPPPAALGSGLENGPEAGHSQLEEASAAILNEDFFSV